MPRIEFSRRGDSTKGSRSWLEVFGPPSGFIKDLTWLHKSYWRKKRNLKKVFDSRVTKQWHREERTSV
jgi:hypothetical protein